MRISRDQKICGIAAFDLRKAFRGSSGVVTGEWLAHRLKIPLARASKLIKDLLREGYIEKQKSKLLGYVGWDLTIQGNALINASAAKPLSRKTAERKIGEFLERVKQVRDDDSLLFKVKRVFIFGSYLTDKEQLGDIDLAVDLVPKESNSKKFKNLCDLKMKEAQISGRSFSSFIDVYAWPEREVLLALKSRSRSLSLHRFNQDLTKISKHVLLYSDPSE